jgi:COX assembly mitochondrial protein 2
MHPPLDRPHPDCNDIINELKQCHITNSFSKYVGRCNDIKFAMDKCLKAEKKRLLAETNKELPEYYNIEQANIIKEAFGQTMTFQEYLKQDKEYIKAATKRKQQQSKEETL